MSKLSEDLVALLENYKSKVLEAAKPAGRHVPRGRKMRENKAKLAILNHVGWAVYNAKEGK